MKKKKAADLSRREFILAASSVGLSLGGCTTMDRLIMGDYRDGQDKVVILGAGLAGLMAAYQLKLRQIPYQIFEASDRIGGRVYTVPEFLRGQSNAELGGEWISSHHKAVFDLAKELKVEIVEARDFSNPRVRRLGQLASLKTMQKELSRLQSVGMKRLPKETLSLGEWFRTLSSDSAYTSLINDWSLERFGAPSVQVRAQAFSHEWLRAGQSSLFPWTESRFRIRNGSSALATAIYDRIGGYQPSLKVKLKNRWRSVRARHDMFELNFDTPSGSTTIFARHVICAVPRPVLSGIDGVSEIGGDGLRQIGVGTGHHSKMIFSYADRFWSSSLDQSKALQLGPGQTLWESSFRANPLFQFRQGILSVLWGGEPSKLAGTHTLESLKKELPGLFKAGSNPQPLDTAIMNWEKATLFQGSVSYPQIGRDLGSGNGLGASGLESPSGWAWAGEHMWNSPGTMEAALRSGMAAVEQILRQNPVFSGKSAT